MASEPLSLFVTGTDTGVGKTLVSAALLHALARRHRGVVGMKPVAAGLVRRGEGWISEDAIGAARGVHRGGAARARQPGGAARALVAAPGGGAGRP
jgi:hypothetical protein